MKTGGSPRERDSVRLLEINLTQMLHVTSENVVRFDRRKSRLLPGLVASM
jgi:hypothetical protein